MAASGIGRDPLHQHLLDVKLIDIVPQQQDVITLEHNQTVAEALKVLGKHRILSAPIVISPGLEDVESLVPGESGPSLLGWLDVKDIIDALLQFLHEHHKALPRSMLALMTELEKYGPRFATKTLITLLGSDDRGLVYQADADMSVSKAIRELFLGGGTGSRKGVHRVAIFDAHGDITHVVSQMDVLKHLLKQGKHLGSLLDRSIESLGWVTGSKALVTLAPMLPTLLAFEQMTQVHVMGAPVVNPEGELVASISISDVRGIQPDHFSVLALPVAEFLAVSHGTSYLGYSQRTSSSAEHPFFANGSTGRGLAARAQQRRQAGPASSTGPQGAGLGRVGSLGLPPHGLSGSPGPEGEEPKDLGPAAAAEAGALMDGEGDDGQGADDEDGVPLVTVGAQATLREVLTTMVQRHVHRVYVWQKGAKPCEVLNIITPTDVLKAICNVAATVAGDDGGSGTVGGDDKSGGDDGAAAGGASKKMRVD